MSRKAKTGTSVILALAYWMLLISPLPAQTEGEAVQAQSQTGTEYQQPQSAASIQQGNNVPTAQPMHTGTAYQQNVPAYQQPQPGIPYQQGVTQRLNTGTTYPNQNQQLINQLQGLLNQQSQLGQYPSNNPLLQGIQNLVIQYSQPGMPNPGGTFTNQSPLPVVGITNQGPGNLMINVPNQNPIMLSPNFSTQLIVGNSISFQALNQNTNILVKHLQNGIAKFWDADDQTFTYIRPNQTQSYNLGLSIQGYNLQKN